MMEPSRPIDWDVKELMERLDGDREFLQELLAMFRQDVRINLEKSRKAKAERDFESLSRTAHTLKGMLRNLSMQAAGETAAALEKAARENRQDDSEQLLDRLVKELEGILPEVEAQLAG
ncbi:MAG TPA: Hpt domain-containing protein [Candidatus Acidoferrum sp.]|nr:Hpt domain-containing protein [Candidatus Acidoferrum sp.]